MKLSQIFTAPNQLTLMRMIFVPFIVIHLVDGHYLWALVVFVIAGSAYWRGPFISRHSWDNISIPSPISFC